MKKNNIAIIVPCLSKGGAERAAGLVSKYISEYTNVYLFLFDTTNITYAYEGTIIDLNFEAINNRFKKVGKFLFKLTLPLRFLILGRKIKKYKMELDISCAISFLEIPNILNLLFNQAERKIVSVRSTRSLQNYSLMCKVENLFVKLLYNKSERVISISEGVKHDLINNFGVRNDLIHTIYNFFDFDRIRAMAAEELEKDYIEFFSNNIVISVGRMINEKRHCNLIMEYILVKEKLPNTKLVIIGSGPLESSIKKIIKDMQLEEDVLIIPYTNNPFKYISRSKVFVLNSVREGFGNVLVEAMACSVPVISTDCLSGPREIIAGNSDYDQEINTYKIYDRGILIPIEKNVCEMHSKNTNHELSKAMIELLTDSDLQKRIIKLSSKYVSDYSIAELKKQWHREIFESNERM